MYVTHKTKPSIQGYKFELDNCNLVIEKNQQEINELDNLYTLEEHLKILKLIVEICTVPVRFQWASS